MSPPVDRQDDTINGVNVALGAILVWSPWLIGFEMDRVAMWTAVIGGTVITLVAVAAFLRVLEWEEWTNVVAGGCVAIAPWVFGFAPVGAAMWTHLILGALVALLAALELWRIHRAPPAQPA